MGAEGYPGRLREKRPARRKPGGPLLPFPGEKIPAPRWKISGKPLKFFRRVSLAFAAAPASETAGEGGKTPKVEKFSVKTQKNAPPTGGKFCQIRQGFPRLFSQTGGKPLAIFPADKYNRGKVGRSG